LFDVASSKLQRIGPGGAVINLSRIDPDRLFLSTRNGLESLHYSDNYWSSEGLLPQLSYYVEALAEDEKGDLFLCTESNGFYWVHLNRGAQPLFSGARIERLLDLQSRAVPSGQGSVCQWQGQMLFVGAGRAWQLAQGENRLEPFGLIAKSLPGRDVQMITQSQIAEDYVWVSSRPPNAGPEIGFEQIVELLGGKISIDSEPGRGSTFGFEIPRRDATPLILNRLRHRSSVMKGPSRRFWRWTTNRSTVRC
jgi:hypothetical protein